MLRAREIMRLAKIDDDYEGISLAVILGWSWWHKYQISVRLSLLWALVGCNDQKSRMHCLSSCISAYHWILMLYYVYMDLSHAESGGEI